MKHFIFDDTFVSIPAPDYGAVVILLHDGTNISTFRVGTENREGLRELARQLSDAAAELDAWIDEQDAEDAKESARLAEDYARQVEHDYRCAIGAR